MSALEEALRQARNRQFKDGDESVLRELECIQALEAACAAKDEALRCYIDGYPCGEWAGMLHEEGCVGVHMAPDEREEDDPCKCDGDYNVTLVKAALAADAGKAIQTELACLRVVCGWVPLSVREAIRTGDMAKCEAWAKKGEDIQAQAYEECAQVADLRRQMAENNIAAGKGEWPKPGYVKDETWARWHEERMVAESIAAAIRAKAPRPEDGT